MSKLGDLLPEAMRAYAAGATLRDIGAMVGFSHEWVRQGLMDAGIEVNRRRPVPELSELAIEVFGDLEDHFDGACTVQQMREWLGVSPRDLAEALHQLRARGWLDPLATALRINPDPPEWREDNRAEEHARIAEMLASGSSRKEVVAALGARPWIVAAVDRGFAPYNPRAVRSPWSLALIEQVSALWKDGCTAADIAERFGFLSRNAVIGKMYRLGIRHKPGRIAA